MPAHFYTTTMAQMLLEAGADIDSGSLLLSASNSGNAKLSLFLIENGIRCTEVDIEPWRGKDPTLFNQLKESIEAQSIAPK